MDVDHITERVEGEIPEVIQYLFPGQNLIRMSHQIFQKAEFFESELYLPLMAIDFARGRVKAKVIEFQLYRQRLLRSSKQRP